MKEAEEKLNIYKITEGTSITLDLIRGISAQLVVVGHGISYCGILTFLHQPNFPWIQNIAVLIFFLLSGFLITYSTTTKNIKKASYSFLQYFIDRFTRIYTAFIPALIFVLFIDSINIYLNGDEYAFYSAFNLKTLVGNILMFQDYPILRYLPQEFRLTSFGSARPFWTLAVEWWIYLFYGFTVLVFIKDEKIKLSQLFVLGGLSIAPLIYLVGGRGGGLMVYWLFGSVVYLIISCNVLKNIQCIKKYLYVLFL